MPPASPTTFRTLRSRVIALFVKGRHAAALAEARALRRRYPRRGEIPFWIACALCRLGRAAEALATLRSGTEEGLWWPADWLRDDDDLAALRGSDGLEAVVAASERLRAARGGDHARSALVLPPKQVPETGAEAAVAGTTASADAADSRAAGATARAETDAGARGAKPASVEPAGEATKRLAPDLLVALHGWGEQAADFVEPWRPAANAGLLVAVPESSHELTPGFFVWGDRERARDDVARALSSLRREWDLDEERGLYAGFSQGGGLAVSWALAGGPLSTGAFLALGAGLGDVAPEALQSLDQAAARGARGRLIVGDADEALADARKLHETLRRGGVSFDLHVVPGLGHDLPDDLDERLTEALHLLLPLT